MKQAVVAFKANKDLILAIDNVAKKENRTRSGLIKHAIYRYFATTDEKIGETENKDTDIKRG